MTKPIEPARLYRVLERFLSVAGELRPDAGPTPSEDPVLLPADLPGLELSAGLAQVRNNRVLYRKLLTEAIEPIIHELSRMLHEASPQAMEVVADVEKELGPERQRRLDELRERVNKLEFEEALALLADIARNLGLAMDGEQE